MTEHKGFDFQRMRHLNNRFPMAHLNLMRAKSKAMRITPVLSDMPHGTDVSSPVERGYMIVEAAQDVYERIRGELQEMRCQLSGKMEALTDPDEIVIMQLRYMDGRSVSDISYIVNYSPATIYRILSRAERTINGKK